MVMAGVPDPVSLTMLSIGLLHLGQCGVWNTFNSQTVLTHRLLKYCIIVNVYLYTIEIIHFSIRNSEQIEHPFSIGKLWEQVPKVMFFFKNLIKGFHIYFLIQDRNSFQIRLLGATKTLSPVWLFTWWERFTRQDPIQRQGVSLNARTLTLCSDYEMSDTQTMIKTTRINFWPNCYRDKMARSMRLSNGAFFKIIFNLTYHFKTTSRY